MAILKIYNPIIAEEQKLDLLWFYGIDGACFKDIDAFIDSIPADDNTIDLRLHCPGGDVSEGWAIVDKLRNTGKEIIATIEGQCASMATVILLAASKRRGFRHASLLIHEPYFPEYTLADSYRASELEALAASLREDTARILDFYVERTGADRAELEALMSEDKFIDMERAKTLGFVQEIVPPRSAKADGPKAAAWEQHNTSTKNSNSMTNKPATKSEDKNILVKAIATIAAALGVNALRAVNYELSTESGDTITIDKPDGEDPAVGDSASPDGEHKMPDGTTIVIADGKITEIREAEDDGDGEGSDGEGDDNAAALATAVARIAELEAELADAHRNAKTTEDKRVLNLVAIAGGVAWLEKAKSAYKPAARQTAPGQPNPNAKQQKQSIVSQRLAAARVRNAEAEE